MRERRETDAFRPYAIIDVYRIADVTAIAITCPFDRFMVYEVCLFIGKFVSGHLDSFLLCSAVYNIALVLYVVKGEF